MSTPLSYAPLQVPEDWTPDQALSVYEYLTRVAEAVWERYEVELLPLVRSDPSADEATHLSSRLRTHTPPFHDCSAVQHFSTGAVNVRTRPGSTQKQLGKSAVK